MLIHICYRLLYGHNMPLIGGDFPGYVMYQGASDKKARAPKIMAKTLLTNTSNQLVWLTVVGIAIHPDEDPSMPDMVICFHEGTNKIRCFEWEHIYQWVVKSSTSGVWRCLF